MYGFHKINWNRYLFCGGRGVLSVITDIALLVLMYLYFCLWLVTYVNCCTCMHVGLQNVSN